MDPITIPGAPAPAFSLPDPDGRRHSLADQEGRTTVLNFWSAECPWSKHADPGVIEAVRRAGADLWTIACCAGEGRDDIVREASARGLGLILLDPDQAVADAYGAMATPHVFVVDPDGKLRYRGAPDDTGFGLTPATRSYLDEALQSIVAGRPVEQTETEARGCAIVRARPRQP